MAQEQYSIENFMNAKVACVEEYISNDINIAEQSLLKFQKIIIHYKNKNFKGIKYDYNLGLVYMRLYLLNNQKGDFSAANKYLTKSLESFSKDKEIDFGEVEKKKDQLINFVEELDRNFDVKWKKGIKEGAPGGTGNLLPVFEEQKGFC
jgi:hypothetical protein